MAAGVLASMRSGQFYKGMINGIEESYESPDLLQILPNEKLALLWDLDSPGIYNRVFKSERVIAKTVVSKAVPDDLGRDGVINHTVLYKFDLYTTLDGARYIFDTDQFVEEVMAGKYSFPMPPTPILKKPLDYPPPMEVQT